ncbi:MAG: TonB-dependent receptor plug domain-containing protein, partial [Woeseiaceae bacterium]|nr:TonB-dependent receptor plug domain-containing protein [Woeseiaceae bacterium]
GQPTLEATLNKMPQLTPDFDRTANNPGNGTSRINLRGMGAGRTLVMLNGRRLASSGIGSAVDANNLPNALIERVEIITGGASTVYGSDAIAGVVNVITRSDFDGVEIQASAYVTEAGDSEIYDVNAAFGHTFASGKGNITFYAGYLDRRETLQGERAFTSQSVFENYQTGELEVGGSFATPEGVTFIPSGNPPPNDFLAFTWDENGDPRPFISPDDEYNYAPINYLQIPLERYTGGLFFNYEFSPALELYSELGFTRKVARQNLAPVPAFAFPGLINTDNPVLSPANSQFMQDNFIPADGVIPGIPNLVFGFFGRRLLELGPRIADTEKDYGRAVVGLRGEIFEDWDYDFWVTYTNGDEVEYQLNSASESRFFRGLLVDPATGQCYDLADGCVPVDIFGPNAISAEAIEYIRLRPIVNKTDRTQKLASFFVRGELGATWAGPIGVAVGVEWREDEGGYQADDLLFTGDALGLAPDAAVSGKESVTEVYAEAIVPLLQDSAFGDYLALELGGRYSEYKNAGSVDSFKLGGDW